MPRWMSARRSYRMAKGGSARARRACALPPSVLSQLFAGLNSALSNAGLDGTGATFRSAPPVVVGLVDVEFAGSLPGPPRPHRTPGTASKVDANIMLSWRLAGLKRIPKGVPRRSTTRWRFVPGLPRSVGFGPISVPPF